MLKLKFIDERLKLSQESVIKEKKGIVKYDKNSQVKCC
jgi:hypothetical protein